MLKTSWQEMHAGDVRFEILVPMCRTRARPSEISRAKSAARSQVRPAAPGNARAPALLKATPKGTPKAKGPPTIDLEAGPPEEAGQIHPPVRAASKTPADQAALELSS